MTTEAITVIALIARYGIPAARDIYLSVVKAIAEKGEVTPAEWDRLEQIELAAEIKARVKAKLEDAGIPTPGPAS